MQVKCVFSLDGNDWEDHPFSMADAVTQEFKIYLYKSIRLKKRTEFKPSVGTIHDFAGNAIGEIVLEEDDDI